MSDTPTDNPRPPSSGWSLGLSTSGSGAPVLKVVLILAVVIGFLIPLAMIRDVIQERQSRQRSVSQEIGQVWGRQQAVTGPVLAVPFRQGYAVEDGTLRYRDRTAVFLPDRYVVGAEVLSETRSRGIYEAVVYTADILLSGSFAAPNADWLAEGTEVLWDQAVVIVTASDLRSLDGVVTIDWNGQPIPLQPGAPDLEALSGGRMSAPVPDLAATPSREIPFEVRLTLKGSESLEFVPMGRESQVSVTSDWPDPSFSGAFLPDGHAISESGFDATWALSYYGRPFPQQWIDDEHADASAGIRHSRFGVHFVQPVSAYLQSERSAKHGVLFIIFTFAVFFLFETAAGLRIHIFQYGLVGMSLSLFYLLLISLAEHLGFAMAYGIGAAAVIGQVVLYTARVLASIKRSATIGALLAALYGGLFVLMGLEDFALLFGSVALFVALGAVMYVTRRIDWYAIRRPAPAATG